MNKVFLKKARGLSGALFFCLLSYASVADPLFTMTEPILWNGKNSIFFANGDELFFDSRHKGMVLKNLKPPEDFPKPFTFLDIISIKENGQQCIYAVSNEGEKQESILYRYVNSEEAPQAVVKLPLGLTNANLYFKEIITERASRKLLLLIGNKNKVGDINHHSNESATSCYAGLFNLTQSKDILKPYFTHHDHIAKSGFQEITQAHIVQLPTQEWAVLLSGQEKGSALGTLQFVFLDKNPSTSTLNTAEKNKISQTIVLDTENQGVADLLLAWDETGNIWEADLKNFKAGLKKIGHKALAVFDQKHASSAYLKKTAIPFPSLVAVKNLKTPGVSIYFLGKASETTSLTTAENKTHALYRLDRTLNGKVDITKITEISTLSALFARSGHLILVPNSINDDPRNSPIVFELTRQGEKRRELVWKINSIKSGISCSPQTLSHNKKEIKALFQPQLLWDPSQQTEVLVSLNQNCELVIGSAQATKYKYGRMLWRKNN